jgi:hypothetical protein
MYHLMQLQENWDKLVYEVFDFDGYQNVFFAYFKLNLQDSIGSLTITGPHHNIFSVSLLSLNPVVLLELTFISMFCHIFQFVAFSPLICQIKTIVTPDVLNMFICTGQVPALLDPSFIGSSLDYPPFFQPTSWQHLIVPALRVFSSACCLAYFESTANHPFLDMIHI